MIIVAGCEVRYGASVHNRSRSSIFTRRPATTARTGAIITITNANLYLQQKRIADLAIKHRLPSLFQGSTWVESGGLMSYSTDELGAFRRAAYYVDRILKEQSPPTCRWSNR